MRKNEKEPKEGSIDRTEGERRPVYPDSAREDVEKEGPDPSAFMCVYAGPEYFSKRWPGGTVLGTMKFAGGPANAEESEKEPENPGQKLAFCPICGVKVRPEQKFCHECGSPIQMPEPEPQDQRRSEEENREDAGDEINDTAKSGEFGGTYGAEINGGGNGSVNV